MSPDDQSILAAELVLGVIEQEDRATALTLLREDPDFRVEVSRWQARFAPLLDGVTPVQPPESVWTAIERRIGKLENRGDNVVQLRRKISAWRSLAGAATAIAASLALVLAIQPGQVPTPVAPPAVAAAEPLVAVLGAEGQAGMLVASWDPGDRQLIVAAAADLERPAGRTHELWIIPEGGQPRSLGTMPASERLNTQVAEATSRQLQQGATLAVSVEPEGGSQTGLPTGPVIASGKLESA